MYTFLCVAQRHQLPWDAVVLIIERLALHYPISNMRVDEENSLHSPGHPIWTLDDFFARIGFNVKLMTAQIEELQSRTAAHEQEEPYFDNRHNRPSADHDKDGEYEPTKMESLVESMMQSILREDKSSLSTKLTIVSAKGQTQHFVHLKQDGSICYEDTSRVSLLRLMSSSQPLAPGMPVTCSVILRSFLPPRNRPKKRIRSFIVIERQVMRMPANDVRSVQLQGGLLPPEANTEYL